MLSRAKPQPVSLETAMRDSAYLDPAGAPMIEPRAKITATNGAGVTFPA
jgi:hypothetical protein